MSEHIKVVIRVRPKIPRERQQSEVWRIREKEIFLLEEYNISGKENYTFDHIFDTEKTNEDVYRIVAPLVENTIKGINATIFAYGQTSSGKTHSIMGTDDDLGIIPRAINHLFDRVEAQCDRSFLIRASFLEIYNEKIYDLLNKSPKDIKLREDTEGNITTPCKEDITPNRNALLRVVTQGNKNRQIGVTNMNERSSRGHVIFKLIVESSSSNDEDEPAMVAQLNIVDLAGSERVCQTKATGARLKEGGHINKSLSTLALVIRQLSEKQEHVNYRDSKLTRMLKNSVGGNSQTIIIAAITPVSIEDSCSTLNFAKCAKTIKTRAHVNEVFKEGALVKQHQKREKELIKEKQLLSEKNKTLETELMELRAGYVKHDTSLKLRRRTTAFEHYSTKIPMFRPRILSEEDDTFSSDFHGPKSSLSDTACRAPSSKNCELPSKLEDIAEELPSKLEDIAEESYVFSSPARNSIYEHLEKSHLELKDFYNSELQIAVELQTELLNKELTKLKDDYQHLTARNLKQEKDNKRVSEELETVTICLAEVEIKHNQLLTKLAGREAELLNYLKEKDEEISELQNRLYCREHEHMHLENLGITVATLKEDLSNLQEETKTEDSLHRTAEDDLLGGMKKDIHSLETIISRRTSEDIKIQNEETSQLNELIINLQNQLTIKDDEITRLKKKIETDEQDVLPEADIQAFWARKSVEECETQVRTLRDRVDELSHALEKERQNSIRSYKEQQILEKELKEKGAATIKELTESNNELQSTCENLMKDMTKLQDDFNNELKSSRRINEEQTNKIEELSHNCNTLELALGEKEELKEKDAATIKKLTELNNELQTKCDNLTEEMIKLQDDFNNELKSSRRINEEQTNKIRELSHNCNTLELALGEKEELKEKDAATIKELTESNNELQTKCDNLTEEMIKLQDDFNNELKSSRRINEEQTNKIEELSHNCNTLELALGEKEELKEKDAATIKELTESNNELQTKCDNLTEEMIKLQDDFNNELKSSKKINEEQTNKIQELSHNCNTLKLALGDIEREKNALKSKVEHVNAFTIENSTLVTELTKQENKITILESQISKCSCEQLKQRLSSVQEEHTISKEKLILMEDEMTILKTELCNLQEEHIKSQEKLILTEDEMVNLKTVHSSLQEKHIKFEEKLILKEDEIENLKTKISKCNCVELKATIVTLQEKAAKMEADLLKEHVKSEEKLILKEKEIGNLKTELSKCNCVELKATIVTLHDKTAKVEADLLLKEHDKFNEKLILKEKEIANLKTKISKCNCENLKLTIKSMHERIEADKLKRETEAAEQSQLFKSKCEEIDILKTKASQHESLRETNENLLQRNYSMSIKISEFETSLATLKRKLNGCSCDKLKGLLVEKDAVIKELQENLRAQLEKIKPVEEASSELEKIKRQNLELNNKFERVMDRWVKSERTLKKLRDQSTQGETHWLQVEIADLKRKLKQSEEKVAALQQNIARQEQGQVVATLKAVEEELAEQKQENMVLKMEVDESVEIINKLEVQQAKEKQEIEQGVLCSLQHVNDMEEAFIDVLESSECSHCRKIQAVVNNLKKAMQPLKITYTKKTYEFIDNKLEKTVIDLLLKMVELETSDLTELQDLLRRKSKDLKTYKFLQNIVVVYISKLFHILKENEKYFKAWKATKDCTTCVKNQVNSLIIMNIMQRFSKLIEIHEIDAITQINLSEALAVFDDEIIKLQQKRANLKVGSETLQSKYDAVKAVCSLRKRKIEHIVKLIEREGYEILNLFSTTADPTLVLRDDPKPMDLKVPPKEDSPSTSKRFTGAIPKHLDWMPTLRRRTSRDPDSS